MSASIQRRDRQPGPDPAGTPAIVVNNGAMNNISVAPTKVENMQISVGALSATANHRRLAQRQPRPMSMASTPRCRRRHVTGVTAILVTTAVPVRRQIHRHTNSGNLRAFTVSDDSCQCRGWRICLAPERRRPPPRPVRR